MCVRVRRVLGECVLDGTENKLEAIVSVAVRRVLAQGVAVGSDGKVEALVDVAVRRVLGEGVVGRFLKVEAKAESGHFAVLDRDFVEPTESNPITCARPAYGVPGAVERYPVCAYDEPIPRTGADVRSQNGIGRECSATYGISEDGRKGEDKSGTQSGKEKQNGEGNRYSLNFQGSTRTTTRALSCSQ